MNAITLDFKITKIQDYYIWSIFKNFKICRRIIIKCVKIIVLNTIK